MVDPAIEAGAPFSASEIDQIERHLNRPLPSAYKEFVAEYGGAFVGGCVDGSRDLPVLSFYRAGASGGILDVLDRYDDLKADGVLPIARCELGNIYVLTRTDEVFLINYYGGRTTTRRVAEGFSDFLARIVVSDD